MASSNRRKKQNRAKAAAKHAEARRRRTATARIRAVQARLSRIYDPGTSAAELAQINRELKQLRVQLTALEERRVALLAELAEQADRPA